MGNAAYCRIVALALATLCVDCSGSTPNNQATQSAARQSDSSTSPTNDWSFQLLFKDDPTRFAIMQTIFEQSGKRCRAVTQVAFKGGLDGTDEWRVDCADSGKWQVWFKPEGRIDFDECEAGGCA